MKKLLRILAVSLCLFGILVMGIAKEEKEVAQGNTVRVGVVYNDGTFVETDRGVIGADAEKEKDADTANVGAIILIISGVVLFIASFAMKKIDN